MDFFDRQHRARRRTRILIAYFVLAVVGIILTLHVAMVMLVVVGEKGDPVAWNWKQWTTLFWQPEQLLMVSVGTLVVIAIGMLWRMWELRGGGATVAEELGGRLVDASTRDADERQLLHVVEEMAIASGTSVPPVYVLDEEPGVNAFAAGFAADQAVIGVTRGALEAFRRNELQGVIAHEFSHILNGDMRLNIRLLGVLAGITTIASIGEMMMRNSSHSRDKKSSGGALGLALFISGWIGYFFGRMIQSAISRQREFLADASAVQFTRDPTTIGSALERLRTWDAGSAMKHPKTGDAGHFLFGEGATRLFGLFDTHPPLEQRIEAIFSQSPMSPLPPTSQIAPHDEQPHSLAAQATREGTSQIASHREQPQQRGRMAASVAGSGAPAHLAAMAIMVHPRQQSIAVDVEGLMASIGTLDTAQVDFARWLKETIPETLVMALRQPQQAQAMACALLLDNDATVRGRQLVLLAESGEPGLADITLGLWGQLRQMPGEVRLTLVQLMPQALKALDAASRQRLWQSVQALIQTDGRVTLFEAVLSHVLERVLQPERPSSAGRARPKDLSRVLAALARAGSVEPAAQEAAFAAGAALLPMVATEEMPEPVATEQVIHSLQRLATQTPQLKRELARACITTVAADGHLTAGEAELLRTVLALLGCPMPPPAAP
ncbi:MAG: M48 family metallopeptidase [Magnetococcales bacterium]|nr:M48 family metallopeptidase [Magnetococcales bacterium]